MGKTLPGSMSDIQELSRFKNIKLIAIDLDGTLIEKKDDPIIENIINLKNSLKIKHNVDIIIATGRTYNGAKQCKTDLRISKDLPTILYNGSLIISNDYKYNIIYKRTIDRQIGIQIVELLRDINVNTYFYDYSVFENTLNDKFEIIEKVFGIGVGSPLRDFNDLPINWIKPNNKKIKDLDPTAVIIELLYESNRSGIVKKLSNIEGISVTSSGLKYIEIRPANSNKGNALEFVSNYLKLDKSEIIAIGDNDNDAEMLSWSGIGIATLNASPKAIKSSDYICEFNVYSGVIQVLKIVKEAKRYNSYLNSSLC